MGLNDEIRILSRVGLFQGLTAEQLRLLAFGAERLKLPAHRRLFREDDEADCAYVVMSGAINLFHENDRNHSAIAVAETGAIIGELSLITETRRLTSAESIADSELLRLNRATFRRIIEEFPDVTVLLYERIQKEFFAFVARIEALSRHFDD